MRRRASGKWAATWSVSAFLAPAPPRPRPAPRLGGARARARGGGWGRIAGEIPWRASRSRPRPGPQRPPGRPGSAMIKAILIFNNHGKPRLSKFYQPYVSIPPPLIRARGGRWLQAAPSGRPPQTRCGPSCAPAASRSRAVSLRGGCEQGALLSPRSHPPTWLFLGSSSARLLPGWFLGSAGEALETSRSRALACRATAAHLRP